MKFKHHCSQTNLEQGFVDVRVGHLPTTTPPKDLSRAWGPRMTTKSHVVVAQFRVREGGLFGTETSSQWSIF